MQSTKCGAEIAASTDPAVPAAEYAKVVQELEESRQQQAATSEILGIISRSPMDLQPVLDSVAESAARHCEALDATIWRLDCDRLRLVAHHGPIPNVGEHTVPLIRGTVNGRAVLDQGTVQVADLQAETKEFPEGSEYARQLGMRTCLSVPLMRESVAIGTIHLSRTGVQLFTERQVALLQTFANQAVIAIENAQLFEEVQARTRELQEALDYQTATSDVLKVISRTPIDLQPVLAAICETVAKLCDTKDAEIFICDGDRLRLGRVQGPIGTEAENWPITRGLVMGRAVLNRELIQVHDLRAAGEEYPEGYQSSLLVGHRTIIAVPLMRKGEAVGVLTLRRSEVKPITDKQITLLRTFADQAVIAIENTRLFEEVQARTKELQDALQQQAGTADVLKTIGRSVFDLQKVLDTLTEAAVRLCGADKGLIRRRDGDCYILASTYGFSEEFKEWAAPYVLATGRDSIVGRAALDRKTVHIPDVLAEWEAGDWQALGDFRSTVAVPLLRDGDILGVLVLHRTRPLPFTGKQIEVLETFADQAVIAIENARVFGELSETIEQQRTTGDILRAIANSPGNAQAILSSIAESAARLLDVPGAEIMRVDGQLLTLVTKYGSSPQWPIGSQRPISRGWVTGRAVGGSLHDPGA
jgi:GAF domain-containing protein